VRLFRADGIELWYSDARGAAAALTLDDDGHLLVLGSDGGVLERLAGPGDQLLVVPGGELRLYAGETVVWREGQHVIDTPDTATIATHRSAAALETLLNALSTPIVRTDFSDDDAWESAWRDITAPREYWDDEVVLYATLVAEREFENWSGEELAALLTAHSTNHTLVFGVDAVTLASEEHPVLVVEVPSPGERPRSFRATPYALLDVEIQLSNANMDWETFSDSVDSDGVLRRSTAH
jgi:hypothetical protein